MKFLKIIRNYTRETDGERYMEYRYDYDVKDDLLTLMENKQDFSGMEELADYLTMYHNERNFQKSALLKFCIYKLSANLSDVELKTFDCDVSKDVIESFPKTYRWLEDFNCQYQRNSTVKYELVNGEKSFRGDTMTSVWTVLKEYIKTKTGTYRISENDRWETYILREIDKINISKDAAEFIQLSHSIGDFIPVPPGFNTGRSNFGK